MIDLNGFEDKVYIVLFKKFVDNIKSNL